MPRYPNALSNPCGKVKPPTARYVAAYIPVEDFTLLKTRFPTLVGLFDVLISNQLHDLCNSIRTYESTAGPIEPAYFPEHPSYDILRTVLFGHAAGRLAGSAGAGSRDVAATTAGIHPTLLVAPQQCPDTKSCDQERDHGRSEEGEEERNRSSSGPDAVVGTIDAEDEKNNLFSLLRLLKPQHPD